MTWMDIRLIPLIVHAKLTPRTAIYPKEFGLWRSRGLESAIRTYTNRTRQIPGTPTLKDMFSVIDILRFKTKSNTLG